MKSQTHISLKTFCQHYQVEASFVHSMHEYELIQIEVEQGESFLRKDELPVLEKMVRLHQELQINPEGIQAVHQLLQHVEALQQQVQQLLRKLNRHTE